MILLFKWIENVQPETVLNIRYEAGEIVFSCRGQENSIHSLPYLGIKAVLEDVRIYQARLHRALDELENFKDYDNETKLRMYGYIEQPEGRNITLQLEIASCRIQIEKYERVGTLFYQLSEHFKAGLITSGAEYRRLVNQKQVANELKEVELKEAVYAVRDQFIQPGNKLTQREICKAYLKGHTIKGKPNYTPEKLSDYASHLPPK